MNGKKARALRAIARSLKLNPQTSYQPVGPEQHVEAKKDHGREYTAGIKRRPFAVGPCFRRAYQEAKAIYKGKVEPIIGQETVNPHEEVRAFRDRMVDSIKRQGEGPVEGPSEKA